ncbi:MAG: CHAT domain-containing tetratricopeptide repeat protein [Microcoleaceae cyanobacterium]
MMRTPTGSIIAVALCLYNIPAIAQPLQLTPPQLIAQQSLEEEAEASLNRGLELFEEGTAESLQAAIPYFEKAATLYEQTGDQIKQTVALLSLGRVHDNLGKKQKALDYYNQALPLARAVSDPSVEAVTLNNIGVVYTTLGEIQKALDYYNQALPLRRATGDRAGEATTLNNIGSLHNALGEFQKALDYYNQALALFQEVGDRAGVARILNNIGFVYDDLGEKQQALDYYNQALALSQEVGDSPEERLRQRTQEATTLNNIGAVYNDLGEFQKALDYLNQALPLRKVAGDRSGEAATLNNIGQVYSNLGEFQKALDHLNQVLSLQQVVSDRAGAATTLNNIGSVYNDLGEKQKALNYYNQALPILQVVGDRSGEARTLSNIAWIKSRLGNLKEALTDIQTVIEIVEDLRSKIGSQDLRASYFATVQGYYKFYIELLMQLHQQNPNEGYDALALHISERSRARSLVELLTEANANIRQGVDPQLLEKEQNFIQQLNAVEQAKHELVSGQYDAEVLEELKQKSQSLLTQLDQLEAEIRVNSPRYADLKYPEPLTASEIQQQVLDEETLLLTYSLGEERSYLWAVTKDSLNSYELPSQEEIEKAAETFRQSVTSSGGSIDAGIALSEIVLSPVLDQLENKRLLIVGDGVLQYVPFVALPLPNSPTTPLLVQNEIVTLSSASTVAIQRQQLQNRTPAPKKLAVLADPVFSDNDERFTGVATNTNDDSLSRSAMTRAARNLGLEDFLTPNFNRLKYTRVEAETILALVPENQQMQAFDFEASRNIATNPNLSEYQIVHLATHGLLDPVNPELSGVVLSLLDENGENQNGFLRLNDIFNLNLPAELVVLSACQTGLGENIKGEGLVGLTRGFMYAGARRVVVSLWSVDDLATSEVMARFYQKMLDKELNPVVALREAQLEMWNSETWQSPYYWAAFTIQGDWKD